MPRPSTVTKCALDPARHGRVRDRVDGRGTMRIVRSILSPSDAA